MSVKSNPLQSCISFFSSFFSGAQVPLKTKPQTINGSLFPLFKSCITQHSIYQNIVSNLNLHDLANLSKSLTEEIGPDLIQTVLERVAPLREIMSIDPPGEILANYSYQMLKDFLKKEGPNFIYNYIHHIEREIQKIPGFVESLKTHHGDYAKVVQEIKDQDLLTACRAVLPADVMTQINMGASDGEKALLARKWIESNADADRLQRPDVTLSEKHLKTIPMELLARFTNLQSLSLSKNDILEVPETIGQFTQLKLLGISSNQIKKLPNSFGKLTQLRKLWLYDNPIKKLPDYIAQFPELDMLHLDSNQVKELQDNIRQLPQLGIYCHDLNSRQTTIVSRFRCSCETVKGIVAFSSLFFYILILTIPILKQLQ